MDRERRVAWRDGDIVTERHFELFEQWIEGRDRWILGCLTEPGLVSGQPKLVPDLNGTGSLEVSGFSSASRKLHVRIRALQGICSGGVPFLIVEPVDASVDLPKIVGEHTKLPVYLSVHPPDRASLPEELTETPHTLALEIRMSLSPSAESLQVGEIVFRADGEPALAADFIPSSPMIRGCDALERLSRRTTEGWRRELASKLERLLEASAKGSAAHQPYQEWARENLLAWTECEVELTDSWASTRHYFQSFRRFLSLLGCSTRLFSRSRPDLMPTALALELQSAIDRVTYDPADVRGSFETLAALLEHSVAAMVERLAIKGEQSKGLVNVELEKSLEYNRLKLRFAGSLQSLLDGKPRLLIRLRSTSGTPLRGNDARLHPSLAFAGVPKKRWRPITSEGARGGFGYFSILYDVEPDDLQEAQLLVYLPPPLGEEVARPGERFQDWIEVQAQP